MNLHVQQAPAGTQWRNAALDAASAAPCAGCRVRGQAMCSALPADAVAELPSDMTTVKSGRSLVREGEERRHAYTVVSGALRRIRLLPDGRRLVAGFLMPGDFIGFSNASHHRHSIEAVEDSTLCALPLPGLQAMCQRYPVLERELLSRACVELDSTRDKLMALARMTPLERLAGFLLDMAARREREGLDPYLVALPMSRADIADYLGLTVETVSRCFTKLRTQGVIASDDPRQVRLLRREQLETLASARD